MIERQDKKTQAEEGKKEGRGRPVTDNIVVFRLPQGQTRQRKKKERE